MRRCSAPIGAAHLIGSNRSWPADRDAIWPLSRNGWPDLEFALHDLVRDYANPYWVRPSHLRRGLSFDYGQLIKPDPRTRRP